MSASIVEGGGLGATCIRMETEEAVALAASAFGLQVASAVRFDTEKDDTFRLTEADGGRLVLKVANPAESEQEISFQAELLEEIRRVDPALPVPRMVRNHEGRLFFSHVDRIGQVRHVRLMSFLEGTPLSDTGSDAREREQVGRVLGLLRHGTAGFHHPGETRELAWDVRHLSKVAYLLDEIEDPRRHDRLAEGLARFATLEPVLARCRMQVLHNDFSRSNIVVDHAQPEFVTGIIDFGDAVRTAVAVDVSTALLNQLPRTPADDMFADARDLLRGYLAVAELTAEEMALVPHLVMGRVILRALLTTWRARLFPDNHTYIMRNTDQGWHQLDWFLSRSADQVSETLLQTA